MKKPLIVFSWLSLSCLVVAWYHFTQAHIATSVTFLVASLVFLALGIVGEKFNRG